VVLQAGSLVLLARLLGAEGYGALAGSVALFVTFAQFVGLGSGIALLRHLARDGELHGRLMATQSTYLITSLMFFAMIWPLSVRLLGGLLAPLTLASLAAAEIVLAPALLPLAYRYQAADRMFVSGFLLTLAPMTRFAAVTGALLLGMHGVAEFANVYFSVLFATLLAAMLVLWPRGGSGFPPRPSFIATLREGLPYSVSGAANAAGSELDKTILLRSAGDVATGQYAAAYRVMQAATMPVNSLILAMTPRLFRASRAVTSPSRQLMLATIGYAVTASIAIWLLAPALPWLLGDGFANSVPQLRLMCVLLATTSIRQMTVAQLTAMDMQASRNWIECIATFASILAMLVVIPSHGVPGAIAVAAVADLSVITFGRMAARRETRPPPKNGVQGQSQ
jgi:O-antigen/teichoic acid export membrane protein